MSYPLDSPSDNSRLYDLGLALLLYLPTLFFVPAICYVFPIVFFLLFGKKEPFYKRDGLVFAFLGLALVNVVIGMPGYSSDKHGFPLSVLFVLPCVIVGRSLRPRVLKYFVYLTLLECVTVVYEVMIHKTYLFAGQAKEMEEISDGNTLLYYFRPYGLSSNSSTMGMKIFIAIVLVYFLFGRLRFPKLLLSALYLCCVLNFNRTAMVSVAAITIMVYFGYILTIRRSIARLVPHLLIWMVVGMIAAHYFSDALFQLTRGGNSTTGVMSGRSIIWRSALEFIKENPIFGNHSMAFRVDYMGRRMHAHNSVLQVLATHGMIGLILIANAALGINKRNFIFIVPIVLFSMAQYGVFWNFSYMDSIFYCFLGWKGLLIDRRLIDFEKAFGKSGAPSGRGLAPGLAEAV